MSVKRKYNKANIHIDGKFVPSKKGKFIVDAEYVRDDRTDKSLLNSLEQIDETVAETAETAAEASQEITERIDNMFNDGKIKSDLLPSYVDDIIEGYYYNGAFYLDSEHTQEIQGESGKIYSDISVTPAVDYRWGGSAYVVHHAQADWGQSDSTAPDYIKNKPTIPADPVQSDWNQTDDTKLDYIKNKPDITSIENDINDLNNGLYPGDWRTLTKDEWNYLINTRHASTVNSVNNARYTKAQVNSVNGLILLPDVFILPAGINMVNINASAAAFTGNIYTTAQWETLESAGCIFLPIGGYRNGTEVGDVGTYGGYWSGTCNNNYGAWYMYFNNSDISLSSLSCNYGQFVRIVQENNLDGLFSTSVNTKCNIAKSNLQFHCLNKEWRFAPNAYDVIGSDNANIAESYNGWIDLFGFGTSGWNSGAVAYQPWSTSSNNSDYINHDLTGAYANADWGVHNIKNQLHEVAFSGDYNDLSNKPVHELAALTNLDDLITNTALIKDHTYYITGGTDVYLATSNATCIKYSGSVYPVI